MAKRKGTYVAARLDDETSAALQEIQEKNKIPNPTPIDEFHITIVATAKTIPWEISEVSEKAIPLEWKIWGRTDDFGGTLVLLVSNEWLTARHTEARIRGATWDFDDYRPHVTLSYDCEDFDIAELEVPDFDLLLNEEYVEDFEP